MRSLTSVQSETHVVTQISLELLSTDTTTTWQFSHNNISNLGAISFDIPFGGGVGKTSNYSITLLTSVDFIKSNLANIINGTTTLRIDANSDTFYPHKGRVRTAVRDSNNLDIITLQVFDQFLESVPKVPSEAIVDSYSTVHPVVINKDVGYPLYYGKHTRPFYHMPVDCNISALLGARNVSSENHVNSVWFNHDKKVGIDTTRIGNMMMTNCWAQQSGSTNLVHGGSAFEVSDISNTDHRLMKYEIINYGARDSFATTTSNVAFNDELIFINGGTFTVLPYKTQRFVE